MTPKIPCMEYVLSNYLSIVRHCRIYVWLFPVKYPKTGVSTPGFGPKMGFLLRNCANTIVWYIHALNLSNDTIFTVIINTLDHLNLVFWTKIMN